MLGILKKLNYTVLVLLKIQLTSLEVLLVPLKNALNVWSI